MRLTKEQRAQFLSLARDRQIRSQFSLAETIKMAAAPFKAKKKLEKLREACAMDEELAKEEVREGFRKKMVSLRWKWILDCEESSRANNLQSISECVLGVERADIVKCSNREEVIDLFVRKSVASDEFGRLPRLLQISLFRSLGKPSAASMLALLWFRVEELKLQRREPHGYNAQESVRVDEAFCSLVPGL
jgi:hypothetical protein